MTGRPAGQSAPVRDTRWLTLRKRDIRKKVAQPHRFLCSTAQSNIFRLRRQKCKDGLRLWPPRDDRVPDEERVPGCGLSRFGTSSPIRVAETEGLYHRYFVVCFSVFLFGIIFWASHCEVGLTVLNFVKIYCEQTPTTLTWSHSGSLGFSRFSRFSFLCANNAAIKGFVCLHYQK